MKRIALALLLFAASAFPALAQDYYDIDVNLPEYPDMQPIPDSPVYYAPAVPVDLFFYGGRYYRVHRDAWFSAPRYDGPWHHVAYARVPRPVIAVPARYYKVPPGHWRRGEAGRGAHHGR